MTKKTTFCSPAFCALKELVVPLNAAQSRLSNPLKMKEHPQIRIEFDGGTPCNVPRLGYGIGYGSYKIDDLPVVRLNHGRPMSANAAEILTLIEAIRDVVRNYEQHPPICPRARIRLKIIGDSQIALKWARGTSASGKPAKLSKKCSAEFLNMVQTLRDVIKGFESVECEWQGRMHSVKTFGH